LNDLLKRDNLLFFLHSRSHNKPDVFVPLDARTQHIGRVALAEHLPFLNGYTMMLTGQTSPETYGQLISWDEDNGAFDLIVIGVGRMAGEGLLILETQEKILHFLDRCVEIILHDLPLDMSPQTLRTPSLPPSLPAPSIGTGVEWTSVAAVFAEAPYHIPVQLNFSRLQTLVNAKRNEAEDHIYALREDPGYFGDFVKENSEHRLENILSENGKRHPHIGTALFWDEVLAEVVLHAYERFLMWQYAQQELNRLYTLRQSYGPEITPAKPLPDDYEEAFCHFSHLITQMRATHIYNLRRIVASPLIRSRYCRRAGNVVRVAKQDDFMWLISRLTDADRVTICGLPNLLDELERLTRNKCDSHVSTWFSVALSEIAVISEIERQIDWHQPKPLCRVPTKCLEDRFVEGTTLARQIFEMGKDMELSSLGTPLKNFDYPWGKRRTATTTERMRTAEENLDVFWEGVDDHFVRKQGKSLHQLFSVILTPRELARTPKWIEPASHAEPVLPTATEDFSDFTIHQTHKTRQDLPTPRVKVKTKGYTSWSISTKDPIIMPHAPSTIAVKRDVFETFSALFHDPTTNVRQRGEIHWTAFLRALHSIGFSIEKEYGSAWLFTPPDNQRPIIFHEPHPSPKIPINVVRRHGRRLACAYGWTIKTFVVQ
jgi:hypothetical protein